jgi:hypothetical protein
MTKTFTNAVYIFSIFLWATLLIYKLFTHQSSSEKGSRVGWTLYLELDQFLYMASPVQAKGNCRFLSDQPDLQIYHLLMDYAEKCYITYKKILIQ